MKREELVQQEAAMAAEKSGNLEEAFDAWRTLSSIAGDRPDYLWKLGRAAQDLKKWEDAEHAFLEALRVASKVKAISRNTAPPDLVEKTAAMAKTLLGSLFLERSDGNRLANARKAKEWLEQAVAESPNQASLSFLGDACHRVGEREAAKIAFRRVIELDETYVEAYINLGLLLSADGQATEAEGLLRKAVQLDSGCPRAHGALGILLKELGHFSEAEAELKRALELNPNETAARNHLLRLMNDLGRE